MAGKEDIYSVQNLEAVLAAMEEDLLDQNEDFSAQIDEVVGELGENQPACSFSCDQCDKICKTQRGLTRHKNTKLVETSWKDGPTSTEKHQATPESNLHPLYFKAYVKKVSTLSNDECYSQNTRDEFLNYAVNLNDTNYTYQLVRNVIGKFKGDGEKFYPEFYKCVTG